MTDRPMTVRQVAELMGISRYAVYDAIRDGKLHAVRFSPKLIRIFPSEVDRWVSGASTAWGALPSVNSRDRPSSDTETKVEPSAETSLEQLRKQRRERSLINGFAAGKL